MVPIPSRSLAASLLLFLAGAACAQAPQAAASAPRPGASSPPSGRWGPRVTPGWSMMTPQERDEHRARMRAAHDRDACMAESTRHREQMEQRARERGIAMPGPRGDACRGFPAR